MTNNTSSLQDFKRPFKCKDRKYMKGEAFDKLDIKTLAHGQQIWTELVKEVKADPDTAELIHNNYFVADFVGYRVENGRPVMYVAPGKLNLFYQSIDQALTDKNGSNDKIFVPSQQGIDAILESHKRGETLRVEQIELNLEYRDNVPDEAALIIFRSKEYETSPINELAKVFNPGLCTDGKMPWQLIPVEKALAERFFGKNIEQDIGVLSDYVQELKIDMLKPGYVKRMIEDTGAKMICGPTLLSGIGYTGSIRINTTYDNIAFNDLSMRAMPK